MSKSNDFSGNNQTPAEKAANYFAHKDIETIVNEGNKNSLYERFGTEIWVLRWLALPIIVSWSVITESLFLFVLFLGILNNVLYAASLTLLLVVGIECLKWIGGKKVIRFFLQRWFKDGRHYTTLFLFFAPLVFISFAASIYLSINGAPDTADYFTRTTNITPDAILEQKLTATNARYDSLIAYENAILDNAQGTKTKDRTTGQIVTTWAATKLSTTTQDNKKQIEAQRDTAINRLYRHYGTTSAQFESKLINRGKWLSSFGGIGELFFIIIICIIAIFEQGVFAENQRKDHPTPAGAIQIAASTPEGGKEPEHQAQQIGFKLPDKKEVKTPFNIVQQGKPLVYLINPGPYKSALKQSYRRYVKAKQAGNQESINTNWNNFEENRAILEKIGYTITIQTGELIITPPAIDITTNL